MEVDNRVDTRIARVVNVLRTLVVHSRIATHGDAEDADDYFDENADYIDGNALLLQENQTQKKQGDNAGWWDNRRRRHRRRRTRRRRTRRRCSTLTSTTTGYYGCHPVFVPVPCVHNVIQNVLNWLNPFHPAGFNIFAWIQTAEKKTKATARYVLQSSHREEPEPGAPGQVEIGDSIAFGCPEEHSLTGSPYGERGFTAQLDAEGNWDPALPDPGCIVIKYRIQGSIIDAITGLRIAGVKLEIDVGDEVVKATSDASGTYSLVVPGGNYTIEAKGNGMLAQTKQITVATDIEPDTSATIYMAKEPSDTEWVIVLAYSDGEGILDSWTKFAGQNVYFGNPTGVGAGISASILDGGDQLALASGSKQVTQVNVEDGCQLSSFYCDVKFMVRDAAEAGNILNSNALVKVFKGKTTAGEFKIEDCTASEEDGWWHVFTIDAKTDKLKWTCSGGGDGGVFLQEKAPQFKAEFPDQMKVDFESYVGPFPGRYWRHSRKHPRKNHTGRSSYLQSPSSSMRGADSSPKKLKVGTADVDVKPMA